MNGTPPAASNDAVIAVVNTNDDLVRVLKEALTADGFHVVSAHIRDIKAGRVDFSSFLRAHAPAVVIYDIAVPYEDNWTFFQTLRRLPESQGPAFVVTTVNRRAFEQRVGRHDVIEIQGGRADDLDPVLDQVRQLTRPRVHPAPRTLA